MERSTRQRLAITAALQASGRALSPAELLADARRTVPAVNLSTVYRHLAQLHASGHVVKVTLPGAAARYEAVCAGGSGPNAHGRRDGDAAAPASATDPAAHPAGVGGPGHQPHHHPHHHHHFHCAGCDRVFALHTCPGPMQELAPPGFEVLAHDVTLYGRCADCAGRAP